MRTLRPVLIAGVFLTLWSLLAQAAINEGLVGYWSFDACDIRDDSGNGFSGTPIGNPRCVRGAQGSALEFDGNNFVQIPDVPVPPTVHSYALWFRPAMDLDSDSPRQDLLYADTDAEEILQQRGRPHITLNHDEDGQIGFHPHIITDDGSMVTSNIIKSLTAEWRADRWYHAVFTWDGRTFRTYIDGELEQTATLQSGMSFVYAGIVLAIRGDETHAFTGSLDEVRMYDRVITQREVRELANRAFASLTVIFNGEGSGSVNLDPPDVTCDDTCSQDYTDGTLVTLTALPDEGSTFAGWDGGGCDSTDTCTVTLSRHRTVTAHFVRLFPLAITLGGTQDGRVTSDPAGIDCGTDCEAIYESDTRVTLTATPGPTSSFESWNGRGCSGSNPVCRVNLNRARDIEAVFDLLRFRLRVRKTGSGNGSIISEPRGVNCGEDCGQNYDIGTVVTLTATPDSRSVFLGWEGGGCAGTGTCTVTVTEALTVFATFERLFTLTVSKTHVRDADGTATSDPTGIDCGQTCEQRFLNDTSLTLTATPGVNARLISWQGGGCSGEAPTCTVQMGRDQRVTATFAPIEFQLNVAKNGIGSGTISSSPNGINCGDDCDHTFDIGTNVTLSAIPNSDSAFSGWGGACLGTETCTITVTSNTHVTATFNRLYLLSLNKVRIGDGDGAVTSSPTGIDCGTACQTAFLHQTEITLSATPEADTRFVGWDGDGCSGDEPCTVVITSARTITATFENPPPVASAGVDQTVDEGSTVTLDGSNSTDTVQDKK